MEGNSLETQEPTLTAFEVNHAPLVSPVITVKEWMITMLILVIPIVNIVMMFVWAFGEGNPTKKNYFKASLIWAAILLVLYIIIIVVFLRAFMSNMNDMNI